jgi:GNAT superfamily N-acetyltransferase
MTPDARRLEELGLNSSAPPGQLVYDGWLLRLLPGKAKRARSVNAIYASTLQLETKLAYCERLYRQAALPALFRITPFSQPAQLDEGLQRRGYGRFGDTSVQSCAIDPHRLGGEGTRVVPLERWVDAIAELRGSPEAHRQAHLARLQGMPLQVRAVVLEAHGRVVATGLAMVEDDCAGLFDIVTHRQEQRRGHARTIVARLLREAWELGARHAYLQVQVDNVPARRLYAQFAFEERYMYWYRGRPGEQQ